MKDIAFACLYLSYRQTLEPFTDAERGRILFAMLDYAASGKEPEFSGNERFIWPSLRAQIDRDKEDYRRRCETNRKNGASGGRPKKKKETDGFPEEPKKANNKDNATANKKENTNTTDTAIDRESATAPAAPAGHGTRTFIPPDAKSVQKYCLEMGYAVDPTRFVDYYTALDWHVGSTPVRDWKALLRTWGENEPDIPYQPPYSPYAKGVDAHVWYGHSGVTT